MAILIQSTTKRALNRIDAIISTLPGAHDVNRLLKDLEETGEVRGKIVCTARRNTRISWHVPSLHVPTGWEKVKRRFWHYMGRVADCVL